MKGNLKRLLPSIQRELKDAEQRREKVHSNGNCDCSNDLTAIGRLAGGISHDFNNVIGAILGWAEIGECEAPVGANCRGTFGRSARRRSERVDSLGSFSPLPGVKCCNPKRLILTTPFWKWSPLCRVE